MKKLILMSCLLAATLTIFAQPQDGGDIVIGKYRTIDSKILGEQRQILVNLPAGYENTELKYPVVFHLYGDFVMTYFADAASFLERLHSFRIMPGVVLVGVDNTDRYRDLRPLKPDGSQGGADKFAQYFEEELIPFLKENYRISDYRILAGPQAGACFGFYTLIEHPGLFDAFVLENSFDNPKPIDDYLISKAEKFFKEQKSLSKFLYIKTGVNSTNYQFSLEQQKVIEKYKPGGLRFKFENSGSVNYLIETGFMNGFMELFSGYRLPDSVALKGLDEILKYYENYSEEIGFKVDVSDNTLHFAASMLNNAGRKNEAKKIYEYILSINPKSLDGLFQMGQIYSSEGKYDEAIRCYLEFLKLRPQETMVRNILQRNEKIIKESSVYQIEQTIKSHGVEEGRELYLTLKKNNPEKKYFDENEFIAAGYRFMNNGNMKDAIEIFQMAVESFPQSFNTWDSLGEVYMKAGENNLAIKNYEKSLELNPGNENARKFLEQLRSNE
ncbi:MAG: tetratricopeptide repeat protein [bacterium]